MIRPGFVLTRLFTVVLFLFLSGLSVISGTAGNATGSSRCGMCHRSKQIGNQFGKWKSGPHAAAFRTLQTEKARKIARQQGVEHPDTDMACLKCHTTAGALGLDTDNPALFREGVGCEACHGPGQQYSEISVMQDRKKAIMKGLNPGNLKDCLKCHNGKCPAERSMDPVAGWNRIAH